MTAPRIRESGHRIFPFQLVSEPNAEIWKGKEKSGMRIAPWISTAIIIAVVIIAVVRTIIGIVFAMAAVLILTIVPAMAAMLILTIVLFITPLFLVNFLYELGSKLGCGVSNTCGERARRGGLRQEHQTSYRHDR
jgi:hypothetical protein